MKKKQPWITDFQVKKCLDRFACLCVSSDINKKGFIFFPTF